MRLRRLSLVVAVLFMPTTAQAHDHRADYFFAFCLAKASNLPGFQFSPAKTWPTHPKLSVIGDFSIHEGTHEDADVTRSSAALGFRWTLSGVGHPKFVPSLQFLMGTVHDSDGPQEGGEPTLALGGAFDYLPSGNPTTSNVGLRVQVDYVINGGDSFPRFSFGLVLRQ